MFDIHTNAREKSNNFFSPVAAGFVAAGFLAGVFDLRSVLDFSASCWKGRYKGGGGSSIREVNVHCPSQTFWFCGKWWDNTSSVSVY